ncbi:MAG: hypothetical protein SA378_08660 [Sedimentibacter sp.]|uniref:hypothetical protein n=1 Tax=Sedimentibacter sp. TaxID=1960295 RepID=UPI0029818D31|nr:hypothetical protein [Sedimentibacter sp.]MDW5300192.1 hypothetical protein [Sedimentibacter sp.]
MKQGYKKIFWGFLITIFNINLGPINILPNFLGYLIIGSGLNLIQNEFANINFKTANKASNFLLLYSIFAYIIFSMIFNDGYQYKNIIETGVFVFGSSISLIMVFNIFSGTIELYMNKEQRIYADNLENTQKVYTILNFIGLLLIASSINISNEVYNLVSVLYLFVIQLYFAIVISKISKTFNEDLIEP